MKPDEMVRKLMECKDHYYNGDPIMSDEEFDLLEDKLRKRDPENSYFAIVGAEVKSRVKVKHETPMLSCAKVKDMEGVQDWIRKIGVEGKRLVLEPKVDGLSCSIVYKNGVLSEISTRGDGEVGQNIAHIAKYVHGIPFRIKNPNANLRLRIEVRGELYLPKNTKLPNPENKPLRNLAVGLVNRKDSGLEDLAELNFVAYQVIGSEFEQESSKITFLGLSGFDVIPISIVKSVEEVEERYKEYLKHLRDFWLYQTDGLVLVVDDSTLWKEIDLKYVVDHHHHYNIALKPPAEGKETIFERIEWNVSRLGKVVPIAIVKPVILGGATVTKCSLNNVEYVENLSLRAGDRVVIERAGEVIPFFKENKEGRSPGKGDLKLIPTRCPSCNGRLDKEGVHLVCNSNICSEKLIMQILHWVRSCEMDGVSESFVRKMVASNKISSIKDLYLLSAKDFEGVEGFGEKKITNALEQIDASAKMSVREFIVRLGVGTVGRRALAKLGINSVEELFVFKSNGSVVSQILEDFVKSNKHFIKDLLSVVEVSSEISKKKGGGMQVCMTGTGPKGRKELISEIEKMGHTFVDHVSKDTNILVCEDVNGSSGKLSKAKNLGVKLVSYESFFKGGVKW